MNKEEKALSIVYGITTCLTLGLFIFMYYTMYQEIFVANSITLTTWGIVLLILFAGYPVVFAMKLLSLVMPLPFIVSDKLLWIAISVAVARGCMEIFERTLKGDK